jgi:predicted restriction endonuclease
LSKTAHWLFDHGFWSITDDLRVIVAADHFDEAGEEAYRLKRLASLESFVRDEVKKRAFVCSIEIKCQ